MDAEAKAAFLAGLRSGLKRDEAAAEAGFTSEAFYYARKRDLVFRLAWIWANDLSAADAHAARRAALADDGHVTIAPTGGRRLQRRRIRRARFTDARKQLFLDRFAESADAFAAAAAAGVAYSTVYQHRRKDPGFAAGWDEALAQAYAQLEAEAVRQRIAAQRRMRANPPEGGEEPKEFERVLQLLARYERRGGRIGMRAVGEGRERRWSFDEAIAALDKKLRALGARRGIDAEPILLPPPEAEEEE